MYLNVQMACLATIQATFLFPTDIDMINTTATSVTTTVNSSDVVRFGCQASGVPTVTSFEWSYPPNVTFIKSNLQYSHDNASVTSNGNVFGKMEYKHSGEYRCYATNGIIKNPLVFKLTVKGKNMKTLYNTYNYVYINTA